MKKNRKMKAVATTLALLVLAAALPLGAFAASGSSAPPEEAPEPPVASVEEPIADPVVENLVANAAPDLGPAEDPPAIEGAATLDAPAALTHEVAFLDADGQVLHTVQVEQGAALPEPEKDPAAPEGARFAGWFQAGATEPFKFEGSIVGGPLELHAVFEDVEPAESEGKDGTEQPPEADEPKDGPVAPEAGDEPEQAPEAEEHTVTFMANGQVWHTVTVPTETLVALPAEPADTEAGAPFVGWFTEDGAPFSRFSLITGNLTLTAKFNDSNLLVTYLDTDGSVLEVLEGAVNEAVPAPPCP